MAQQDAPVVDPVAEGLVSAEAMAFGAEQEGLHVTPIFISIAVVVVFVVVAVIAMFQITNLEYTQVAQEAAAYSGYPEIRQLQADAAEALSQYRYDEANDVYRVPIERAMQLMVNETAQDGDFSRELPLRPGEY